jgi:hypothetical protein
LVSWSAGSCFNDASDKSWRTGDASPATTPAFIQWVGSQTKSGRAAVTTEPTGVKVRNTVTLSTAFAPATPKN